MAEGQPCAFHDGFMSQIRDAILALKEQMAAGVSAIAEQSRANGKALAALSEAQNVRRELCARQEVRIHTVEREHAQHREDHKVSREEYLGDRDSLWDSHNALKKVVYIGLGIALAAQAVVPFILKAMLEHMISTKAGG